MMRASSLRNCKRRRKRVGKGAVLILAGGIFLNGCIKSPTIYKKTFLIAGTYLEVLSPHPEAAGIVYNEFQRLDKIFNGYDQDSELAHLNRTHQIPITISEELMEVLTLSGDISQATGGAFDISYGAVYQFWKDFIETKAKKALPSSQEVETIQSLGGMRHIVLDHDRCTATLTQEGLKIDLSGIAKGYMVDKAVSKLKEQKITDVLINAGGDIYCLGTKEGQPWVVGVRNPQGLRSVIKARPLVNEAIATSGDYEQFFQVEGKRYSHLIDPRSGYPVTSNVISVSVVSARATTADAFATAFFIMGIEEIKRFLSSTPLGMRVFVLAEDEEGIHTHAFP